VINTTWKVIGKKYGKRTLHIKHVIFFGAYWSLSYAVKKIIEFNKI
jgi:hypothetical protein